MHPYLEALPRLLAAQVLRARRSDDDGLCRFVTRSGQERGWLEVLNDVEDGFAARWKFTGPGLNSDVGQNRIPFVDVAGKVGRPAPFRCQKCKRQVGTLVFRQFWACAKCQGLRHRSTFLGRAIRDAERQMVRHSELCGLVRAGRPKHMKHETYRRLKMELRSLDKSIPHLALISANRERMEFVLSEWMSQEKARQLHGYNPELVFVDGSRWS